MRRRRWRCAVAGALWISGCASVAAITNLNEDACGATFTAGLSSVLVDEGETEPASERLARRAKAALEAGELGPRPFLIAAPSGTDYTFFVDRTRSGCLLRLYGRRHGFWSYTNNLTYIATRPLTSCQCRD
jgi:hypothetical protein